MNRDVPMWVLLLCLLLGALFVMLFGWSIKSTLSGSDRSGRFGEAAVAIASFPALAKSVFTEVRVDTLYKDELVSVPASGAGLSGYTVINARPGMKLEGLYIHADLAALSRSPGWRIVTGAFSIDGKVRNAAIALSPELEIVNIWILTEDAIEGREPRPPHRKLIHGLDVLSDGSVIFSFDHGISLQRFDQCGSRIWAIGGDYHHAVTLDEDDAFVWTLRGKELVKVSTATGEIERHFSLDDISTANPELDILEIRKADENDLGGNSRNTTEEWLDDPVHLNDVDPLPAAFADSFEAFKTGDLLVSARSLNLVFIVDPDTLKIKWWRAGATRRQHDPDWGQSGVITVYDNRMGRDYSRIVSIEPKSFRTDVLFDGRKNDFYSRVRGKHQFTESGNLIVTSAQQGRAFEIDSHGDIVLEFVNRKPGSDEFNYALSEVIWLPPETFSIKENFTCKN